MAPLHALLDPSLVDERLYAHVAGPRRARSPQTLKIVGEADGSIVLVDDDALLLAATGARIVFLAAYPHRLVAIDAAGFVRVILAGRTIGQSLGMAVGDDDVRMLDGDGSVVSVAGKTVHVGRTTMASVPALLEEIGRRRTFKAEMDAVAETRAGQLAAMDTVGRQLASRASLACTLDIVDRGSRFLDCQISGLAADAARLFTLMLRVGPLVHMRPPPLPSLLSLAIDDDVADNAVVTASLFYDFDGSGDGVVLPLAHRSLAPHDVRTGDEDGEPAMSRADAAALEDRLQQQRNALLIDERIVATFLR